MILVLDLAAWRSRYMRPIAFWPCLTTGVAFIMIINVFVENHYTKNLSYICHMLFGFICISRRSTIFISLILSFLQRLFIYFSNGYVILLVSVLPAFSLIQKPCIVGISSPKPGVSGTIAV